MAACRGRSARLRWDARASCPPPAPGSPVPRLRPARRRHPVPWAVAAAAAAACCGRAESATTATTTVTVTLPTETNTETETATLPTSSRSRTATYTLPSATDSPSTTLSLPQASATQEGTYTIPSATGTGTSTMMLPTVTATMTHTTSLPSETSSASLTLPSASASRTATLTLPVATSTSTFTTTATLPSLTASRTLTASFTLPSLTVTATHTATVSLQSSTVSASLTLTPRWAPWQLLRTVVAVPQPQNSWAPFVANGSESGDPLLAAGLTEGAAVYQWRACFRPDGAAACTTSAVPAAVARAVRRANVAGTVKRLSTGAESAGGASGTLEVTLTATHPPTYRETSVTEVTRLEPRLDPFVVITFPRERPLLHRPGAALLLRCEVRQRLVDITQQAVLEWNCTGIDLVRHRRKHPSSNYLAVGGSAFTQDSLVHTCWARALLPGSGALLVSDPLEIQLVQPPAAPAGARVAEFTGLGDFGAPLTAAVDPSALANVDGKALWARFAYAEAESGREVPLSGAWERVPPEGLTAAFATPIILAGDAPGARVRLVTYLTASPLGGAIARTEHDRAVAVPAPPGDWGPQQLLRHGAALAATGAPDALVSAAHIAANLRHAEERAAGDLADTVTAAAAALALGVPVGAAPHTARALLGRAAAPPQPAGGQGALAALAHGLPEAAVHAALRTGGVPLDSARAALAGALDAAVSRRAALRQAVHRAVRAGLPQSVRAEALALNSSLRMTAAEGAAQLAAESGAATAVDASAVASGAIAAAAAAALASAGFLAVLRPEATQQLSEAAAGDAAARSALRRAAAAALRSNWTTVQWTGAESARQRLLQTEWPEIRASRVRTVSLRGAFVAHPVDPAVLSAAGPEALAPVEAAAAADLAAAYGVQPGAVFAWLHESGAAVHYAVALPPGQAAAAGLRIADVAARIINSETTLPAMSAAIRALDAAAPRRLRVNASALGDVIFAGAARLPLRVAASELSPGEVAAVEGSLAGDFAEAWGTRWDEFVVALRDWAGGTVAAEFQVAAPAAAAWDIARHMGTAFADLPLPRTARYLDGIGREHKELAVRDPLGAVWGDIAAGYAAESVRDVLTHPDLPPGRSASLAAALRDHDAAVLQLQRAASTAVDRSPRPVHALIQDLSAALSAATGGLGSIFGDDDEGRAAYAKSREAVLGRPGEEDLLQLRALQTGGLLRTATAAVDVGAVPDPAVREALAAAAAELAARDGALREAVRAAVAAPGLSGAASPLLAHAAKAATSTAPSGRPARLSREAVDRVLELVAAVADAPAPLAEEQGTSAQSATLALLLAASAAALEQMHRDTAAARHAQQAQPGRPGRGSGDSSGGSRALDSVPEERFRARRCEEAIERVAAAAARALLPAEGETVRLAALAGNASALRPAVEVLIDRVAPGQGLPNPLASDTCSVAVGGEERLWARGRNAFGSAGSARPAELGPDSLPARLAAAAGTPLADVVMISQEFSTHWWQAVGGGFTQQGGTDSVSFAAVAEPAGDEPIPGISLQAQQWLRGAAPPRALRLGALRPRPVVWLHSTASVADTPQRPPQCVFWNDTREEWSSEGVSVAIGPGGERACATEHFTSFAMVVPPFAPPPPPPVPVLPARPPPPPPPAPPPPPPDPALAASDDDCPPHGCPWWWPIAAAAGLVGACSAGIILLVCLAGERKDPGDKAPGAALGPEWIGRWVYVGSPGEMRPALERVPALAALGWGPVYEAHSRQCGVVGDIDPGDDTVSVHFPDGASAWYPAAALRPPDDAGKAASAPFGLSPRPGAEGAMESEGPASGRAGCSPRVDSPPGSHSLPAPWAGGPASVRWAQAPGPASPPVWQEAARSP